jgi:sec-independent protein translocase protein TatB
MEIFGLTLEKLVVVGVIAGVLLGPERLSRMAAEAGQLLRRLRQQTDRARQQMRDELGSDVVDFDWQRLDPRRYDPRRIIADALLAPTDSPAPPPLAARGLDPIDVAAATPAVPTER